MHTYARLCCILCFSLGLAACAPMLAVVGYSGSFVQVVAQVERVKLVGDGVSFVGSGKTITDHALSMVAGADCRITNVLSRDPVCAPSTAADARVRLSRAPASELLPQPSAPAAFDADTENSPPASEMSAGGE